jgi:hypothetical protein
MGRACSTNGPKRNTYKILVGTPEGKRPLGRSRRRWVNNIKIDLRETGWGGIFWIWFSEHGNEHSGSIKFLSSCTTGSFSRRAHLRGVN